MYGDFNEHAKTGSYYDTDGGYIHYDSSENLNQPKKKKKGGFGKTLAKCLVLALVFGSVSSAAFMGTNYIGRQMFGDAVTTEGDGNNNAVTPTTTVAGSSSDVYDVSDIVTNCMPSVVSITNVGTTEFRTFFGTYEQESQSSGSGIIIGRNDTEILIVTNNHVVSKANEISVYFNSDGEDADEDNVISAKVKGTDPGKDLAVIAVKVSDIPQETLDIIKIATIGDSGMLAVGEPVVAIGNAYGYGLSVTSGIVSALNREVSVESDGMMINNRLIQTDAAINPGNSGGALLNSKGELIGINSVKFISEEVEGMGYAIPISDVETIIGDLMNKVTRDLVEESDRGYLGITGVDVTTDASKNYGMPEGVYINTITEGGAAEKAGLQKGDIITKLDGSRITGYSQLRETLSYYSSGETISITIQRMENSEYAEKVLEITLSSGEQVGAGTER
ncbi:MAG: trypsin-like serine protease [Lachnospiraceae bacterium]|jgi:serine protease Do|nr:trypsin-like serine protease [Lachnospiraceae bacterium]MCI9599634.1 trypsin-like serine protease [Lachnospiraceae bacterium]